MSADLEARRRASFSLRFCFADFPPSSKSSIAVGTILGGRYAPPASSRVFTVVIGQSTVTATRRAAPPTKAVLAAEPDDERSLSSSSVPK